MIHDFNDLVEVDTFCLNKKGLLPNGNNPFLLIDDSFSAPSSTFPSYIENNST